MTRRVGFRAIHRSRLLPFSCMDTAMRVRLFAATILGSLATLSALASSGAMFSMLSAINGCGGPPEANDPTSQASASTSTVVFSPPPPSASSSVTAVTSATVAPPVVEPDVPQGNDAKRDAELLTDAGGLFDAFWDQSPRRTPDGKRVVFKSNRDGIPQLYVANIGDAGKQAATRLVTLTERVGTFDVTPEGDAVVFASDKGADENWSFFKVSLDGKDLTELTPGTKLNRDQPFFPRQAKGTMVYSARASSEKEIKVFVQPIAATTAPKLVYSEKSTSFVVDVSADGKRAILLTLASLSDSKLTMLDLETGKTTPIYPAAGKTEYVGDARFSADGSRIQLATDGGGEEAIVLSLDATSFAEKARYVEKKPATARILELAVGGPGGKGAFVGAMVDAGNHMELRLLDASTLAPTKSVTLPLGAGGGLAMSDDGKHVTLHWSTPESPSQIYDVDAGGKATLLRKESFPGLGKLAKVKASITEVASFDGQKIPVNLYLPEPLPKGKKLPTVVVVHGGPASSYEVRWSVLNRFFLAHGFAIVEPNVRGSTGFGRKYEQADDGPKRMDAVKDVEEIGKWAAKQPWADESKLVILGGSYGGYMTLMGVTNHPKLWKAGVDLFGIYSWRTFMTTTSGVIRDIFQKEIGPESDGAFLDSISPSAKIDQVVAPLFVYAGQNDPRVPRSESDAIVQNLRARKIPVEYMVAANEGHSLDRKESITTFLARSLRFLEAKLNLGK